MKNVLQIIIFCFIAATFSCKKDAAKPTGSIMLVNNSANPYDVYVNGKLEIDDMAGSSATSLTLKPVGYYSVRVIQVSGYAFYPTDLTYNGDLADQGTLVVSFPE
jgi:hypothetical protein